MKYLDTIKILNKYQTKMIAHRGLSGLEKENTMCAFICANARTYYGTECDIRKTKDNYIVVCHDDNLKRVSGIDANISTLTFEELQKVKLFDNFDNVVKPFLTVPLFSDYLDCAIKYNKYAIIELKDDFSDDEIIQIINLIKQNNYLDKCILISFSITNLIKVRQINKTMRLQYLISQYDKKVLELCVKYNMGLDCNYTALTKQVIDDFHKYGLAVNAWTVNDCDEAIKLIEYGIDYITTNILE